jgi:hypothetical protein
VGPQYGYGDGNAGAESLTVYDDMDRPMQITGPDKSAEPSRA